MAQIEINTAEDLINILKNNAIPSKHKNRIISYAKVLFQDTNDTDIDSGLISHYLHNNFNIPLSERKNLREIELKHIEKNSSLLHFDVSLYESIKKHPGLLNDPDKILNEFTDDSVILYFEKIGQFVKYTDIEYRENNKINREELKSKSNLSEAEIDVLLTNNIYNHVLSANLSKSRIFQIIPNDHKQKIIIVYIADEESTDIKNRNKLNLLREHLMDFLNKKYGTKISVNDIVINNYSHKKYYLITNVIISSKKEKEQLVDELKKYIGTSFNKYDVSQNIGDESQIHTNKNIYAMLPTKLLGHPKQKDDLISDANRTLDKILATSTKDCVNLVVINYNDNRVVNNININSNNINSNNTSVVIKNKHLYDQVVKFANFIKNRTPGWYKPGELVQLQDVKNAFSILYKIVPVLNKYDKIYTPLFREILGDGQRHELKINGAPLSAILLKTYDQLNQLNN
jgi:hypothetical protein